MRITILCPSPLSNDKAVADLIATYSKRMDADMDIRCIKIKSGTTDSGDIVKKRQGDALLTEINKLSSTCVIALDEKGRMPGSPELAKIIEDATLRGFSHFCYIIGGAYGLSQDVLNRADIKLSFGKMVWPHRLVAVMLLEQLYRAQQINKGHPYHKE